MPPRVAPPPPLEPSADPSSPYYVHASDGPSSVKVTPVLNGSNYHAWSRTMRCALGGKLKLEFIDGTIPVCVDPFDPSYRAWNRCNMLVHSWILNSVSESIAQSLVFMENAIDVWLDLKDRFSQGDFVRIAELQQEICALKQENRSVTEFYSSLKLLLEELEIYMPIPNCTCRNRCNCDAMRTARLNHQHLHTIRFLTGLNENFAVVKSQVLLMDPLPSLTKVFSLVLQHERQGGFNSTDDSMISTNFVKTKGNSSGSNRQCTYCGRDNHTVQNCFKKHGLPPHLRNKSSVNAAIEGESNDGAIADSTAQGNSPPMTQDQASQLITLLQQSFPASNSTSTSSDKVGSASFIDLPSVNQGNSSSCLSNSCSLGKWLIDSGASHHICNSVQWFHSYNEINPITIRLPNGDSATTKYSGSIHFSSHFILQNVLCVPNFSVNLISISKLLESSKYLVSFHASYCSIQDQMCKRMIGFAKVIDGLYYLQLSDKTVHVSTVEGSRYHTIPAQAIWHFWLGHLGLNKLLAMHSRYSYITVDHKGVCDICHFSKQKKLPFQQSLNKALHCYDLLHVDIWGPISTKSINGHSYFLTIVDDFSRFTWVILMKQKSEARQKLIDFITLIKIQHNVDVKMIRSDNGPEFIMPQFYSSKGIIHQTSCVETPQQNGRVERKHQQILNIARALLFQAKLPKYFWSYAVLHAIFLINRVPSPILQNKCPYELLNGELPDLSNLKVFGSLAYATTLQANRTKLSDRSRKCIYLGHKSGVKGTILYDLHSKEIFISRNVSHHDNILPYESNSTHSNWHYHIEFEPNTAQPEPTPTQPDHHDTPISNPSNLSHDTSSNSHLPNNFIDLTDNTSTQNSSQNDVTSQTSDDTSHITTDPHHDTSQSTNPPARPTRAKHAPSYLMDYVCNASSSLSTSSSKGTLYPLCDYHTFNHLSPAYHAYTLSITHNTEPTTYLEACKSEHWRQAMRLELDALTKTGTWKLVDMPTNIKPIGSKWVYKVKYKSDGSIERYKARLVAKGYNQIEGLDYFETFSPVAKLSTVRILLALASINNWHLHQLDVNNAFLHGELQEDVYMSIPEGVQGDRNSQVCKLMKSLYGLKQASRKWYEKLTSLLISEGYTQSSADYSLFILSKASQFTALLVYVDDIILAGNDLQEFTRIKNILDTNFKIKDLGILKYFLGLEVAQSKAGISITQRKYCLDLLKDSGLLGSKPAITPLDPSVKLHQDNGALYDDISSYRRLIGKLLYLTNTRPDISLATQQLSQFLHKPTMVHYKAACRVVRYLKQSPGKGLMFPRSSELQILGYSDADWAGCLDTRRSTSGYCFFLGNSLVSWKAKKQVTVSRSSSEAEYRALSTATCELLWMLHLLKDLGLTCDKLPVLYCDSQSAVHIASNPVFHERTKHLDIDCHLVREKLQQGLLKLLPVSTNDQLADFLTKALPSPKFNSFVCKLGMIDLYHPQLE
ncbi:putative mitochondrial protein [Trifolium repens]|nr:putative mitochondrial protein [Trifolium repens]